MNVLKEVIQIDKAQFQVLITEMQNLQTQNQNLAKRVQDLETKVEILQAQQMRSNSSPMKLDEPSILQETMNNSNNGGFNIEEELEKTKEIDNFLDVNQSIEISLQTHNLPQFDKVLQTQYQVGTLTKENVNRLISYIFQKLTLQRGREKINSARDLSDAALTSFKVDSDLIDNLLNWTSQLIQNCYDKIDQNGGNFLDLIQLFIDLLKETSIPNQDQKKTVEQIYEMIDENC